VNGVVLDDEIPLVVVVLRGVDGVFLDDKAPLVEMVVVVGVTLSVCLLLLGIYRVVKKEEEEDDREDGGGAPVTNHESFFILVLTVPHISGTNILILFSTFFTPPAYNNL
jgi:hypothetical protein